MAAEAEIKMIKREIKILRGKIDFESFEESFFKKFGKFRNSSATASRRAPNTPSETTLELITTFAFLKLNFWGHLFTQHPRNLKITNRNSRSNFRLIIEFGRCSLRGKCFIFL